MSRFHSPRSVARQQALNRLRELEREREVILANFAELRGPEARQYRRRCTTRLSRLRHAIPEGRAALPAGIPLVVRLRFH
jgi:ElaB/YqjD/DUF883 family membrane-anchored ribosome-binding protein